MRLIELKPKWISDLYTFHPEVKFGVTFLCPHCRKQRLAIFFDNPIGGINHTYYLPKPQNGRYWGRSGETFETLSLTPSIDASQSGHWHGFITNGEVK